MGYTLHKVVSQTKCLQPKISEKPGVNRQTVSQGKRGSYWHLWPVLTLGLGTNFF